jgi:hypothetical protein
MNLLVTCNYTEKTNIVNMLRVKFCAIGLACLLDSPGRADSTYRVLVAHLTTNHLAGGRTPTSLSLRGSGSSVCLGWST